jgi:NAD(P)-dependent dehydrogenase (short-subunit alcohol dehydrogenase family)
MAPQPASARPPLSEVRGRTAFITGGSSGIGLGLARAFAAAGMKVAFTWRRTDHRDEALQWLGADRAAVLPIELDVTDRDAFARAADEVEDAFGAIHLFAGNAGVGIRAGAAEATFKDWDWGLGVNLGGVINGIVTLLPRMRAHGQGAHLLATSSSSGLLAGGGIGVYVTAKFALMGLMESLREELAGQNIGVSIFCPGFVRSNLLESERMRPAALMNEIEKPSTLAPSPQEETMMRKFMAAAMDPLAAGELVIAGIRRNDLYILTHQEFAQPTRERMEALLASFPTEEAPRARAMLARRFISDLYASERDRLLSQRRS